MSAYTLQHKTPRNPIMSDEAIKNLPGWAQAVIRQQRELEQYCSLPVVEFTTARKAFSQRAFLVRSAANMWGGDGAATRG